MARYPQYLEAPLRVEPRDSCLHQPYAFVRCMRIANGVNEQLAVAYEWGLAPVFMFFDQRHGSLHRSLLRLKGAAVDARRGVPSVYDRFSGQDL